MGAGFSDWHVENVVESAKKTLTTPPPLPPPAQRYLPGISPGQGYQLESF